MEDLKLIELYIEGKLSGESLTQFEARLKSDTVLHEKYKSYKAALKGITIINKEDLKNQLETIHDEVIGRRSSNRSKLQWYKIAAIFIENGAKINHQDKKDWSPLMLSAYKGHLELVKSLLSKGADKSLKNSSGQIAKALAEKGKKMHPKKKVRYQEIIANL